MIKAGSKLSDSDFILGLRNGDESVLSALYKKYYNLVLKFVVSNNGSSDAAKDIYQESIIVLFEKCKDPGFQLTCGLQTYIYSVARNLWLKQLKKHGSQISLKEYHTDLFQQADTDLKAHDLRENEIARLSESMNKLGEPCATLLKDFYVKKMSMEDISDKFGYTNADNAKNQKYKCLQRLKRLFFDNFTLID